MPSDAMRSMCDDVIDAFGEGARIRVTDGTRNAQPKAIVSSFERSLIDGTQIQSNDLLVLISANELSFEPKNAKIDNVAYAVIDPSPVEPGDSKIMWRLHLREV